MKKPPQLRAALERDGALGEQPTQSEHVPRGNDGESHDDRLRIIDTLNLKELDADALRAR